jgi:hypothetical protein
VKVSRGSAHRGSPVAVDEQSSDGYDERIGIVNALRCPRSYRARARFAEVEGVRTDENWRAHGERLDQILSTERQQAPADKG